MKEYPKPYLDIDQQLALLKIRGMIIPDEPKAKRYLRHIGYYRLSAYWYVTRAIGVDGKKLDDFVPGTTFDDCLRLYIFDRKLRILCMDALGRIENTLKTSIALRLGERDKYAHLKPEFFASSFTNSKPKYKVLRGKKIEPLVPAFLRGEATYDRWVRNHKKSLKRAQAEVFVKHVRNQYDDCELPIWMVANLWDMDAARSLMTGMQTGDKLYIAKSLGLHNNNGDIIVSWFKTLCLVRNICAHHGRLWNRGLSKSPALGKVGDYPAIDLVRNTNGSREKIFSALTLIQILLNHISPNSNWKNRVYNLLTVDTPNLTQGLNIETEMGFPENWRQHQFWNLL